MTDAALQNANSADRLEGRRGAVTSSVAQTFVALPPGPDHAPLGEQICGADPSGCDGLLVALPLDADRGRRGVDVLCDLRRGVRAEQPGEEALGDKDPGCSVARWIAVNEIDIELNEDSSNDNGPWLEHRGSDRVLRIKGSSSQRIPAGPYASAAGKREEGRRRGVYGNSAESDSVDGNESREVKKRQSG
jgi:hypothetical protein